MGAYSESNLLYLFGKDDGLHYIGQRNLFKALSILKNQFNKEKNLF